MKYLVLYDFSKKAKLPLGDFVRILDIIKFENFVIASNIEYNDFFSHFNKKPTIDINHLNLNNSEYKIINLILGKIIKESFYEINNYLNEKTLSKINTYELLKDFIFHTGFKPKYEQKKFKLKENSLIGFNWLAPEDWKIKLYPMEKWIYLEKNILKKYKTKISWQKNDNLKNYIKWIKSCDLIISIVGLGVHIATYFNKNIIMLSGPTDFSESNFQKNIVKILPDSKCEHRPCNMVNGVNNCGCMPAINANKILNKFEEFIN